MLRLAILALTLSASGSHTLIRSGNLGASISPSGFAPPGAAKKRSAAYLLVGSTAASAAPLVYWSDDGTAWEAATGLPSDTPTAIPYTAAGSGQRWVMLGGKGASNLSMYSDDGKAWLSSGTAPNGVTWNYSGYNPAVGLFMASSSTSGSPYRMLTSPNGETWTAQSIPSVSSNAGGPFGFNGTLNLFVSPTGFDAFSSTDSGVTWAKNFKASAGSNDQKHLPFNGTNFVVADGGNTSPIMQYTTDGVAWNLTTVAGSNGAAGNIAWNGTIFCAVGAAMYTSSNGVNWTHKGAGPGASYRSMIWDAPNNRFFGTFWDGTPTTTAFYVAADCASYSVVPGALPSGIWRQLVYVAPL